jgi:hypothetical protein
MYFRYVGGPKSFTSTAIAASERPIASGVVIVCVVVS